MDTRKTELLHGTLELLVLRVLTEGALHGYAIGKRIRERSRDVLQVEHGSLYPALYRLERRGFIRSSWGRSESNRRVKDYSLTPAGQKNLLRDARDWRLFAGAVGQVLGDLAEAEA